MKNKIAAKQKNLKKLEFKPILFWRQQPKKALRVNTSVNAEFCAVYIGQIKN